MDRTTKKFAGDDASKAQDGWPVRSLRYCSPSIYFLTIMDVTRPAGPVATVPHRVSR